MKSFKQYLGMSRCHTHLIHVEDAILEDGAYGGGVALHLLEKVADMLSGSSESVSVTTKFDGAPAILAGTHPETGKFFVATKSFFNVTPKVNYTPEDIRLNHSGELAEKLQVALEELPKLGIEGILQGDMMFGPGDVQEETINGQTVFTFTPNTITYSVPVNSALGRRIAEAKMGVVFHTSYEGDTVHDLKASFGASVAGLNETKSVWFDDATFKGQVAFTKTESAEVRKALEEAKASFRAVSCYADTLRERRDFAPDLNIFINSKVREGTTRISVAEFREWFGKRCEVKIQEVKTVTAKSRRAAARDDAVEFMTRTESDLQRLFDYRNALTEVKLLLVRKLEEVQTLGTFLRTDEGFKPTMPEGFVAVGNYNALKLVDRLEFSRANFSAEKNWSRG